MKWLIPAFAFLAATISAAAFAADGGPAASQPSGEPATTQTATQTRRAPVVFFGLESTGSRVVYVIDHSGSLLDNFDFLRAEVKRSVNKLDPGQSFAVVAFSEDAQVLGPPNLRRPTADVLRDLQKRLDDLRAQGQNDDSLPPFQSAFEKAFALKPDVIFFLTDGHFDPKLDAIVMELNKNHAVRINTLAFVAEDADYKLQMQKMAKENGGTYKFVSANDPNN